MRNAGIGSGQSEKEKAPGACQGATGLAVGEGRTARAVGLPAGIVTLCDVFGPVKVSVVGGSGESLPPPCRGQIPGPRQYEPLGIRAHKKTEPVAGPSVSLYPHGVQTYAPAEFRGNGGKGGKRGYIEGWSKASRKRLREALLNLHGGTGTVAYSATFTVPGEPLEPDQWRKLWNHAGVVFRRLGVRLVWRVELQERGQPHVHGIGYAEPSFDLRTVAEAWHTVVESLGPSQKSGTLNGRAGTWFYQSRMHMPGAFEHAALVEWDKGTATGKWFRYLADHASKSKQAQLGWKGRQWGIINRRAFSLSSFTAKNLTWAQYWVFMRSMRRLTRSHVLRGVAGRSVWFTSPETAAKLVQWARSVRPGEPSESDFWSQMDRVNARNAGRDATRKRRQRYEPRRRVSPALPAQGIQDSVAVGA